MDLVNRRLSTGSPRLPCQRTAIASWKPLRPAPPSPLDAVVGHQALLSKKFGHQPRPPWCPRDWSVRMLATGARCRCPTT
jgi:hypothetical protein